MAVVISGNGIDMGGNPVSNASQIDGVVINENGDSVATTSNLVGFKNYIINGGFDIWQRGTAIVPALDTGTFIADRFHGVISGAGKNFKQTTLDANYVNKYGLSIDGSLACTNAYIITRLESINTHRLHGKTVTLSCKVFASNAGAMAINIDRPVNADIYGEIINLHTESVTLVAGVNNVSFSFTFNEVDPTYGIQIAWIYGALGANDNRVLADVQLEEGSVATPFENRPIGLELSLCQRYYERMVYNNEALPGTYWTNNGGVFESVIYFKGLKRVTPSITVIGTPQWSINEGTWTNTANSGYTGSPTKSSVNLRAGNAGTMPQVAGAIRLSGSLSADAEL